MPTYQYRCTECGHDLEAVQKFTDAALTECPSCSGSLRKVYNAVGVVFKGSGFYRTDSSKAPSEGSSSDGSTSKPAPAKEGASSGSGPGSGGSGSAATSTPAKGSSSSGSSSSSSSTDSKAASS